MLLVVGMLAVTSPLAVAQTSDEEDLADVEVIDMSPEDDPSFSMREAVTPIKSLFGGSKKYYADRELLVETTPADGIVDLFYVRSGFQKRFEQAETPVIVQLPPRVKTGPRDSLTVRAFAEGYRQKRVTLKADTKQQKLVIDLEPLPNLLEGVGHRYFAGRASLTFLTKEPLQFRLQEADDGFTVILTETANTKSANAALEGARSPLVEEVYAQQLGEDLVVRVSLAESALDGKMVPRTRESYEAARDLHAFVIDLTPADGGAEAVGRALDALDGIGPDDVAGCALEFDGSLHQSLDLGALNRALTPKGSFTDPYLRAAMRRLGEVSPDGIVRFASGAQYRPAVPIELEAALSQAGEAMGFLALLRQFVINVEGPEYADETLRSLIAPELEPEVFVGALREAREVEEGCRAKP